jgi:hypothetical protein
MADDRDIDKTNVDSSEQREPIGNIDRDADGDSDERMRGREGTDDDNDLEEEGDDLQELQREGNLGNERVRDRDM